MELVQTRIVTDEVEAGAAFYTDLAGSPVPLNEYYVEVPTGAASTGFSRSRYAEEHCPATSCTSHPGSRQGEIILDVTVDDAGVEFERIKRLGAEWLMPPTAQQWGTRSMLFRDPEGHLVNVFARTHSE